MYFDNFIEHLRSVICTYGEVNLIINNHLYEIYINSEECHDERYCHKSCTNDKCYKFFTAHFDHPCCLATILRINNIAPDEVRFSALGKDVSVFRNSTNLSKFNLVKTLYF